MTTPIEEIVQRIGTEYGYEDIHAQFCAFADVKIKWQRTCKWIDISVSDYLNDAPEDVLTDLLTVMFRKIRGENADYSQNTTDYLTSEGFRAANRSKYFKRKKANAPRDGRNRIAESLDRVKRYTDTDGVEVRLLARNNGSMGETSQLMRCVLLSPDMLIAPDYVLDYALLFKIASINVPFGFKDVCAEREKRIKMFPEHQRAVGWLEEYGILPM